MRSTSRVMCGAPRRTAQVAFVALGYMWVDAVAAILVALLVLFVSYRLGRRTMMR
jgi:divalent metal cation (Fe/Co/Zn/Cd) transporter